MRQIFVDTSAWAAIDDSGDPNHNKALLFRDEIAETTDCTSNIVMKMLGVTEVFAFDHRFAQMGFIKLP